MIRNLVEITFDASKKYIISAGNSSDESERPTSGIITGSKFYEVDTGIQYEFDEDSSTWYPVGLSSQEITDAINAWLDDHPEATTTVQDGSITYAKLYSALQAEIDKIGELETAMETKADEDGYYESMTVGDAEQLVATVGVNDKVPYLFRTSGGSADIGDREVDKVVGGSFPWNQMTYDGNFTSAENWQIQSGNPSMSVSDNAITVIKSASGNPSVYDPAFHSKNVQFNFIKDHIYIFAFDFKSTKEGTPYYRTSAFPNGSLAITGPAPANTWKHYDVIRKCTTSNTEVGYFGQANAATAISTGDSISYRNLMVIDLTQLFGSTIADYIYSLESSTPGAGVAWFRKLFNKPYYQYCAGSMESVETDLHKMTGFNAYNHATGKAKVVGGYEYEIVGTYTSLSMNGETITPVSGKFTPAESGEITVTGGDDSTTCIHLRWDGERDGEYEPYVAHEYALSPVVLRGVPYLDSGNKLAYKGDVYHPDGTVDRLFAEVDLGTLDYTYDATVPRFYTSGIASLIAKPSAATVVSNIRCAKYIPIPLNDLYNGGDSVDLVMAVSDAGNVSFKNSGYSNAAAFKTAMSGVKLVYELATPTTEQANPYQTPQIVDDWGTEEYRDALATAQSNPRDVAIPVGHDTTYRNNLRAKLEMAPESPSGDGDYILRQTSGQNQYVLLEKELPTLPTEDGTYTLKCTVSGTTKTLSWEADAT